MNNIIYIPDKCKYITTKWEFLNLNNKICKIIIPSKNEWIYFKFIDETLTSFSGIRLQQDQYNNRKFYLKNEKNKWFGIINDGSFSKGRRIYVFN